MPAGLLRIPMNDPADVPVDLGSFLPDGHDVRCVRAVVVKSEGNGCVNDFSRSLAARAWQERIPSAVTVVSGGTEGVLSPHATLLYEEASKADGHGDLVVGVGRTPTIGWAEIGTAFQAQAVSQAVADIRDDLEVASADVAFVLVKCPLLTQDRIEQVKAAGREPGPKEPYESMAASRAASALGTAHALGELGEDELARGLVGDRNVWSAVASASAGAELNACNIVMLARKPGSGGTMCATNVVMNDAIDAPGVLRAVSAIELAGGRVRQIFAKADPDPTGTIRGHRHTMLTDSDLHSTRHARAAVGGLLAGLAADPMIYVSGGAENQGPPGGGPVVIIWEPSREGHEPGPAPTPNRAETRPGPRSTASPLTTESGLLGSENTRRWRNAGAAGDLGPLGRHV